VLISPKTGGKARGRLIEAAKAGQDLDPGQARYVRVIEYEVPDRDGDGKGELIALITTIADPREAPAAALAEAYHQRWQHDRQRPAQDAPARPRQGTAVTVTEIGRPA
jgi:hypothetical protein